MDPVVSNQSFFQKYRLTIISIFVILLAAVPLLLLSNNAKTKTAQVVTPTALVSPTPGLTLTPQNADSVLSQTDIDMQQTLDQTDTDLKDASQVDASQDSTTGL